MAENKISLPSSGGGLLRYSEEAKSKFMIAPIHVVITIGAVILIGLYLYKFGL